MYIDMACNSVIRVFEIVYTFHSKRTRDTYEILLNCKYGMCW